VAVTITGTNDAPNITVETGNNAAATFTETDARLTSGPATLSVKDLDLSDTVTASVDSVAVSGTGALSVPGTLTNAVLQAMMTVNAGNVIGNTQMTGTITWSFDSGAEAFDFLAKDATLILTYTIRATDAPVGASDTQEVMITVTGTNDPPVITTITSEENPIFVPENTIAVATITATDPDTPLEELTFSIAGGPSSGCFEITPAGVLTFKTPPDFENPADADADNGYTLSVKVEDGKGGSDVKVIWVRVTDENETPTAEIQGAPVVSPKGNEISLNGVFTNLDAGDTHAYDWEITRDGEDYANFPGVESIDFTPSEAGTFVITLTVDDGNGGIGSDAVTIVVVEPGKIESLQEVREILDPAAQSGFLGFVSRQWVDRDNHHVENGKHHSLWVVDTITTLSDVAEGKEFSVLELSGHGGFYGAITWGNSSLVASPGATATGFGESLKANVLKDRPPGILILSFCLSGTVILQDSPGNPHSVPQRLANATGWTVLSAGGFSGGHFARLYEPGESVLHAPSTSRIGGIGPLGDEKTNWQHRPELQTDGLAYESADHVWYLSTPE
jgi:VCBS repeat-containing protein